MPHLAIEAIKVKLDSTGKEVLYEPNTDMTTIGVGILIETAHIIDTDTGIETEVEAGQHTGSSGSGGGTPVPTEGYEGTMTGNSDTTVTDLGNGDWNIVGTSANTNSQNGFRFYVASATIPASVITFEATVNSGSFVMASYFDSTIGHHVSLPDGVHDIVDGINTIRVGEVSQDSIIFYQDPLDNVAYDIDFRNITIVNQ